MSDDARREPVGLFATVIVRYSRLEWLIPLLLCAILVGELFLTSARLSQTADEATHLYAGYRYLKCGDLTVSSEHPPLAKIVAAAPLLAMNISVDCRPSKDDGLYQAFAAQNWFYTLNWPIVLARARAAACLFTIGLFVVLWIAARRMFGFWTALVASLLLIFEPNVLAYGSLVLTDVPVTCMLLCSVVAFYFWTVRPKAISCVLAIVAAGMTLLAKQSGLVVIPVLAVLAVAGALTEKQPEKWKVAIRNLGAAAIICCSAFLVVWLGYGMRFAPYSTRSYVQEQPSPDAFDSARVLRKLEDLRILPLAYLEGLGGAMMLSHGGSDMAFVAGKIYPRAPWFSTPFNFMIRSTLGMFALMALSVLGLATTFRARPRELLFMLVPASVYLGVCLHASSNVSMRYLLPMVPFLLVGIAAGCVEMARRVRWLGYIVAGLLLVHGLSSLHAYPDYLSYANEMWGGPSQAYKYEPWVDVGQSYNEAKTYLSDHPSTNCWLVTAWQWDPGLYDLPCQTAGLYFSHRIPARVQGTVIVSSTLLSDVRLSEQGLAHAFRGMAPKAYLGGSALLVYEGEFDTRLNAAISERNLAAAAFNSGQVEAAVEHGRVAMELAPDSAIEHGDLCIFLATARTDQALPECYKARELLLQDPLREEAGRKKYLKSLEDALPRLESTSGDTESERRRQSGR